MDTAWRRRTKREFAGNPKSEYRNSKGKFNRIDLVSNLDSAIATIIHCDYEPTPK
jgi:hypothetical protein